MDGELKTQLLKQLRKVLPESNLLTSSESMRPFECDGLSAYRQLPGLVVLPDSIDEVQHVMKTCYELKVPVIARGSGTGLSGGSLPREDAVLLSLSKFNRILQIDYANQTARVQPGVRNVAISEAVAAHGLYYAPDPSSQIICSIGGNMAENAGGVHCLKYGLTVHNLLAATIVMADGELLDIGSQGLEAPGLDLMALFTGSEGLLGIIVDITVKLLAKPQQQQAVLAAFGSISHAGKAVASIIGAGIIPGGLEMMDRKAIEAVEAFAHCGYPECEALLICELDGTPEDVHEQIERVTKIVSKHKASEVRVSHDEKERELFWKGRKSAFPAAGRLSPDYYCMDGTIPRKQLSKVLTQINKLSERYDLPVANVFHAGDGNLHPLILFDANVPGELEKTEEFGRKILELCIKVGGTITGEHGVGVEKLIPMCEQFSAEELDQFLTIKSAFDDQGLLNPGKAIPTLQRCAEFGAMHVSQGHLPFADIERF